MDNLEVSKVEKPPFIKGESPETKPDFEEMSSSVNEQSLKIFEGRYPSSFESRKDEITEMIKETTEEEREALSDQFEVIDKNDEARTAEAIDARANYIVDKVAAKLREQTQ